jgi:polysaccharide transporter, PST family
MHSGKPFWLITYRSSQVNSTSLSSIVARVSGHSELRRIIANVGWLFFDRILALLVGFLVGAWVARYLGPAQYGLYNYALVFSALFMPVVALGLENIVIRELVLQPQKKEELLGTAFILQLFASLLVFGLIVAVAYWLHHDDTLTRFLIAVVAGGIFFKALSDTVSYWFRAQVLSKYIVWSANIALAIVVVIKISLLSSQAPLSSFAWALLAQAIFFTLGITVFYHLSGQKIIDWRANFSIARRLLRDSWPLIFSGLAVVIYMKIDQLMLGNMVGNEALGIYSVAVHLSELWYFIPMVLASSVFPAIVRAREKQTQQIYQERLQFFYDIMALVAYAIAIPFAILAPSLVILVFGSAYAEAGSILTIHIWAFIFVSLGVARSQWLIAENMTRFAMFATIVGATVNVGMNLILIPRYGGIGAAWATLVSYAVAAYFSTLFINSKTPVFQQLSLALLTPLRPFSVWRTFIAIIQLQETKRIT